MWKPSLPLAYQDIANILKKRILYFLLVFFTPIKKKTQLVGVIFCGFFVQLIPFGIVKVMQFLEDGYLSSLRNIAILYE